MKIDSHYYGVLAFARAVGFKKEYAHIIAYASQFVDDAKINHITLKTVPKGIELEQVSNRPSFFNMATCHSYFKINTLNYEAMINNTIAFHFVPGCKGKSFSKKLRCGEESPIILDILKDIKKEKNLIKLGMSLHIYADTFSHQGFSGLISKVNDIKGCKPNHKLYRSTKEFFLDKIRSSNFLNFDLLYDKINPTYGHSQVLTYPDIPYLEWQYAYDFSDEFSEDYKFVTIKNAERYLHAFQKIRIHLEEYLGTHPYFKDDNINFENFDCLFETLLKKCSTEDRISSWKNEMIKLGLFDLKDNSILNYDENLWLEKAFKNYDNKKFNNRRVDNVELQDNFEVSEWYTYYKAVKWYKSRFFKCLKKYSFELPN